MESSTYVSLKNGSRHDTNAIDEAVNDNEYKNDNFDDDENTTSKPNTVSRPIIKEDYIYDDEDDDIDCLRYANPLTLALAWAVLFTMVFCVLYYGIMNGLRNTGRYDLVLW